MTKHLYYSNAYLIQFEAIAQEYLTYQGQPAVILDQSAFYPTGGGQPHDTGKLNDVSVVEVVKDETTNQVIHILNGPLQADTVVGQVDWIRRFDLMQQHSGQHILSQAMLQTAEAMTVGFHLSGDYATIDLSRPDLTETDLVRAEELANKIIYDNRNVTARFVTEEELATIPLRKKPVVTGPVRIVEIENFDWSACGGTHVTQTGEIGIIKIVKSERRKPFLRLTFLCGQRALHHYHQINRQISDIALHLSVSVDESFKAIQRQSQTLKQSWKEKEQLGRLLLSYEADTLVNQAPAIAGVSIVSQVFEDKQINDLRQLAQQVIQHPDCVVLFGLMEQKGQLIFARSANLDLNMSALLKNVSKIIGGGGGGSPHLAQGGGPQTDKVPLALAEAQKWLKSRLSQQTT